MKKKIIEENGLGIKIIKPDPALKTLEKLIGIWDLRGRTLGSNEDNIFGWSDFEWMPGGLFMKISGEIEYMGFKIESLEIIAYDPENRSFPSKVYSNISNSIDQYYWDIQGDKVLHWMESSKYSGTFSKDGNTLSGGWRPINGIEGPDNTSFDAVMTRRKL
jgi:hypothetical protein